MEFDTACHPLRGLRVLLVEDSSFLGVIFAEMLNEAGCHVCGPLRRIDEAMARAVAEPIDVAILDVSIDGTPIFGVADVLAARDVPILLMSGYPPHTVPEQYRRGFLQKPFDEAQLLSSLLETVARHARGAAA